MSQKPPNYTCQVSKWHGMGILARPSCYRRDNPTPWPPFPSSEINLRSTLLPPHAVSRKANRGAGHQRPPALLGARSRSSPRHVGQLCPGPISGPQPRTSRISGISPVPTQASHAASLLPSPPPALSWPCPCPATVALHSTPRALHTRMPLLRLGPPSWQTGCSSSPRSRPRRPTGQGLACKRLCLGGRLEWSTGRDSGGEGGGWAGVRVRGGGPRRDRRARCEFRAQVLLRTCS